ncbi:signal peptidase I [Clostridium folliculivorans]|uniref:Signal peptidase I n=1 Tax=Clostridium folliculivorans TaxID=2886038 RepID=A0A9W5Y707_9CLOT|nr:signal peptidase I [Clostridium folliculivorans]GKU27745.1 signal peptidase I [Clostridium folliculivorans]GKU32545.1 signal peptidase I [Clostridium folliculivorans]
MIEKRKIFKEVMSWIYTIAGALILVTILDTKVFAMVQVQQRSMENTLHDGQELLVDKVSYDFTEPQRGDVVIFLENRSRDNSFSDFKIFLDDVTQRKQENTRLVKRVIGIPGDEIDLRDGYVYLNGEKLNETYTQGTTVKQGISFPLKVSDGKLFVLGDNREVSIDSRSFGLIDKKQIEGKARLRVWPLDKISSVK